MRVVDVFGPLLYSFGDDVVKIDQDGTPEDQLEQVAAEGDRQTFDVILVDVGIGAAKDDDLLYDIECVLGYEQQWSVDHERQCGHLLLPPQGRASEDQDAPKDGKQSADE